MTAMTSYLPGMPSWVDIATPDIELTRSFYSSLFSWEVVVADEETGYSLFRSGGRLVAGATSIYRESQSASWNTYISVTSVNETVRAATYAGATVTAGPEPLLAGSQIAVLSDPAGASISIWQPDGHIGADAINEPGCFCWNELQSDTIDEAKQFYSQVFGWTDRTSDFGGMAYVEWLIGEESVAGMMEMPPTLEDPVPPFWLVYFGVEDCDAAVAHATELGGIVLVPPFDSPAGRFAVLQDSLGASLALISLEG